MERPAAYFSVLDKFKIKLLLKFLVHVSKLPILPLFVRATANSLSFALQPNSSTKIDCQVFDFYMERGFFGTVQFNVKQEIQLESSNLSGLAVIKTNITVQSVKIMFHENFITFQLQVDMNYLRLRLPAYKAHGLKQYSAPLKLVQKSATLLFQASKQLMDQILLWPNERKARNLKIKMNSTSVLIQKFSFEEKVEDLTQIVAQQEQEKYLQLVERLGLQFQVSLKDLRGLGFVKKLNCKKCKFYLWDNQVQRKSLFFMMLQQFGTWLLVQTPCEIISENNQKYVDDCQTKGQTTSLHRICLDSQQEQSATYRKKIYDLFSENLV